MKRLLAVVLITGVSLWNVHAQVRRTSSAPASPEQKQILELKAQIAELKEKIKLLETKDYLQDSATKRAGTPYASAMLDLATKAFQRVDTSTGTFFVSVEDVAPYLDGYRVTLNIGNPSYARYQGAVVSVTWNSDITKITNFEQWSAAMQSKEISVTKTLEAGTWNKVELLLPSTKADQLGYFMVSMKTDSVMLH